MKNKRLVNRIISELPELIQNKVISKESAEKIRGYYNENVSDRNIVLTIFSVIGVSLITLGIISLLAYNWTELSLPLIYLLRSSLGFMAIYMIAYGAFFSFTFGSVSKDADMGFCMNPELFSLIFIIFFIIMMLAFYVAPAVFIIKYLRSSKVREAMVK